MGGIVSELDWNCENVDCSQTQQGQLVDRLLGAGIILSRSVVKPGGFYAEGQHSCSLLSTLVEAGKVATVAQW